MPRDPLPPRRTTADRLREALLELAENRAAVRTHREKAWASVTFEGSRHTVTLRFDGHHAVAAGEQFIAALPEHEFAILGQLVADATVTRVDHTLLPQPQMTVECELLLLVDA
ncbi:hypothetical protein [Pelagerythrobacter aerophilus]|uniref:Uncharacterized protein n=1 Tax=Pelagerythrobacter aerophilus TaxID=2306995 RepID=A0A418NFU6_9SPHN|nr:hypothetical protein [Pelagerythrobacter aerophilus]RIV76737.1 hypothetical protein D2V04_11255 [Pelagerythrobacter aerophilus]